MTAAIERGLAVEIACVWEALARKVGNVHRHADFTSTTLADFLLSALAVRVPLAAAAERGVGVAIRDAVAATREVVGQNTNLGIVLLLAPLTAVPEQTPLRSGISDVLDSLTVADAEAAFQAILLAAPGGLGEAAEQDVHAPPTQTLLQAMALAADRDLIARQYATGYHDVFSFGVPTLLDGFTRFGSVEAAIVHTQLHSLAVNLDTLIVRKAGQVVAEVVRKRAAEALALGGLTTFEGRRAGVALDRHLRSQGNTLNPGATADLIAACLYIALRERRLIPSDPFPWTESDWL